MGALEMLYGLIYGTSPQSSEESDLLNAPKRLKLYALQKLLQGHNAISDYRDMVEEQDIERQIRLEGKLPFENRQNKWRQSTAEYARQKLAKIKEEEAASQRLSGTTSSGVDLPVEEVAKSEKASEYGPAYTPGTPEYKERVLTPKPTFNMDEWKRAIGNVENWGEILAAEEDAARRADSVRIDIPGGYEGMQRIVQQAGGTPGGGTLSIGGGVTGGDTTEDLRKYVNDYRFSEVDRQIGLIEQAFPAANRPPALDARLQSLYEARANRDREETLRQRLPIEAAQAEADLLQAEGSYAYNTQMPGAQRYAAEMGVEEARLYAQSQIQNREASQFNEYNSFLLAKAKAGDMKAIDTMAEINKVIYNYQIPPEAKHAAIMDIMRKAGYADVSTLTGTNLATKEGEDELDVLIGLQ